jgi:hypothetical protein
LFFEVAGFADAQATKQGYQTGDEGIDFFNTFKDFQKLCLA